MRRARGASLPRRWCSRCRRQAAATLPARPSRRRRSSDPTSGGKSRPRRAKSASASSKKSASPALPSLTLVAMSASYDELLLIALSKIVGFDVNPVTENSSMYRFRVPLCRSSRVMLSSQRLWPRSCNEVVAFIASPPVTRITIEDSIPAREARRQIGGSKAEPAEVGKIDVRRRSRCPRRQSVARQTEARTHAWSLRPRTSTRTSSRRDSDRRAADGRNAARAGEHARRRAVSGRARSCSPSTAIIDSTMITGDTNCPRHVWRPHPCWR